MTATTTSRMTVAQLLAQLSAEQTENLVPVDGDRAFTIFHGLIWEGILKKTEWDGKEGWGGGWVIIPADGKPTFDHPEGHARYGYDLLPTANVTVYAPEGHYLDCTEGHSYDRDRFGMSPDGNKLIRFDTKRGMFYLRAIED